MNCEKLLGIRPKSFSSSSLWAKKEPANCWFFSFYYIAYFFIRITPLASTISTAPTSNTYVFTAPVLIDNSTSAISISSSPSFLLFGVESLSGIPFSL